MASDRNLAVVAGGGVLGAAARYGVAQLVHAAPGRFPWATFWTNVSGSFALGVVLVLAGAGLRLFLATGFLGAYTTYSSFAVETDVLLKDGHAATALAYVGASLACGLAAAWLAMTLARRRRGTATP